VDRVGLALIAALTVALMAALLRRAALAAVP